MGKYIDHSDLGINVSSFNTEHIQEKIERERIIRLINFFCYDVRRFLYIFNDWHDFTKEYIKTPRKWTYKNTTETKRKKIAIKNTLNELLSQCKTWTAPYYDFPEDDYNYIMRKASNDEYGQFWMIWGLIKSHCLKNFLDFGIIDYSIDKYLEWIENPWEILKIIYFDLVNKSARDHLLKVTPNNMKAKIAKIIIDLLEKSPEENNLILKRIQMTMQHINNILEESNWETLWFEIDLSRINFSIKPNTKEL